MKKNKGFTLIELMIVVAIIAIIAAIAIPNLLRSRIQSNESAAIGNLRTVVGAQTSYHSANNGYATDFATLTGDTPPYLDGAWDATKSGYDFAMGGSAANFTCAATPAEAGTTGVREFFVDASGVIRVGTDATGTPIGE
ncbi:MAG: hypothetical protein RLZZ303_2583 [Candidatus Hydrogenedentota bacterium]|jgi:prepilin-type N-terminal cleavage/methylation domain-containing protein